MLSVVFFGLLTLMLRGTTCCVFDDYVMFMYLFDCLHVYLYCTSILIYEPPLAAHVSSCTLVHIYPNCFLCYTPAWWECYPVFDSLRSLDPIVKYVQTIYFVSCGTNPTVVVCTAIQLELDVFLCRYEFH